MSGFHNHPVRDVVCRACGTRFRTGEPGRRAWYCRREACIESRAVRARRKGAKRVAERRRHAFGFVRRWQPLVERVDGEVRLQTKRPRDHEPAARLSAAIRLLAGAREMEDHDGEREALLEIAARALAWRERI